MEQLNFLIPLQNKCFLSTKRMESLKGKLPTKIVLQEHLKLERRLMKEVENYTPEPFKISLSKEEMSEILKEINSKGKYGLPYVYLLTTSEALPVAVISEIIVDNQLNIEDER